MYDRVSEQLGRLKLGEEEDDRVKGEQEPQQQQHDHQQAHQSQQQQAASTTGGKKKKDKRRISASTEDKDAVVSSVTAIKGQSTQTEGMAESDDEGRGGDEIDVITSSSTTKPHLRSTATSPIPVHASSSSSR